MQSSAICKTPDNEWACRVYSRIWSTRVKWAPVCNFRGPFSSKAVPQKVFELIGTDCSMTKKSVYWRFAAILEPQFKSQLMQLRKEAWKNSGLPGFKPWPPWYRSASISLESDCKTDRTKALIYRLPRWEHSKTAADLLQENLTTI